MMDSGRKTAFQILFEVEKEKAFSNLTANRIIKDNNPENPAFVRELVYGVLENKMLLDYYIDILVPSGIGKVKDREKTILRMGIYQINFMDSVPDYAAVSETVSIAKKLVRGREGFINGVLRSFAGKKGQIKLPEEDRETYLSVKYSFPLWIIRMWRDQYGDDSLEEMLASSNGRPKLCVRVNLIKTTAEGLAKRLERKGFKAESGKLSDRTLYLSGSGLTDTDEYKDGLFSVQDEASLEACYSLEARPGDTVVDVCAAPGGKTLAIGEMMENEGRIIACDVYSHKLKLIKQQADRLNIDIVETEIIDGVEGASFLDGLADRVLVDAPCSGLGVIRRKPEIKYKESIDLSELISLQAGILDRASHYVKPGGILVYSTCTVNKDENDLQTEKFLEKHRDYEIIYKKQFLPTDGTDGFFIAKMKKKGK